jgi:hypothetical protein
MAAKWSRRATTFELAIGTDKGGIIFGRVDSAVSSRNQTHSNLAAATQHTELFETLDTFERMRLGCCKFEKVASPVGIDAQVL